MFMAQTPSSTSYDAAAAYLLLEKSQDIYNLISPYLYMLAGILPKWAINAGLPLSAHIPEGGTQRDRLATRVYPSILEAVDATRRTDSFATGLSVGMIVDAIEYLSSRTSRTTIRHLIIVAMSAPHTLEEDVTPVGSTARTVWMELAERTKQANIMLHIITGPGDRSAPLWAFFDECVQYGAFAEDTLPFAIDRSRVEMRLSAAIIRPAGKLVESGSGGSGKLPSSPSRKSQRGKKQRYEPYLSQSRVTMSVSPMDINLVEQIQMRFGLHHGKRGRKESCKASELFCRDYGLSDIAATKDILNPDVTGNMNHRRVTAESVALISPKTPSGQIAPPYLPNEEEPVDDSPSAYLPAYQTPEVMVAPPVPQVYVPHQSREPMSSPLTLPQNYVVPHSSPVVSTAPVVVNQPPNVDQYWDQQYTYTQVSLNSPAHASELMHTPTTIYNHEDISHTDSFAHGTFDMAINHTSSYATEAAPVGARYDPDMTALFGYDPTQFEVMPSAGPSPSASTSSYSLEDDGAYHLTSGQSLVLPSNSNTGVQDFASRPPSPCQTKTPPLESPAQHYDSSRDNEPFTFTADYFTATDALAMKYFQVSSSGTSQFIEAGDDALSIIGPPPSDTTGAIYNSHFSSRQQSSPIALSNFTSYTLANATSYAMGWAA